MTELETALCMIGFKKRFESFVRLQMAVQLVLQDDNRIRHVQRDIYEPVGAALGCSWNCVEHSIRHRIKAIWDRNPHAFDCLCRAPLYEQPTTTDLIEYLAEYVREQAPVQAELVNI